MQGDTIHVAMLERGEGLTGAGRPIDVGGLFLC